MFDLKHPVRGLTSALASSLAALPYWRLVTLCLGLTGIIGGLDYLARPAWSPALLFFAPVWIAAWYGGHKAGLLVSLTTSVTWGIAEHTANLDDSQLGIIVWDTVTRFGLFAIISLLLSRIQTRLRSEETLADTDPLTGALNRRAFYKRAAEEIQRCHRYGHPFTLAYIDVDNFKSINDDQGHLTGDELLRTFVRITKAHIRTNDTVARLGGDEFAILFVETTAEGADEAYRKLYEQLTAEMQAAGWPVSFSIGMVSYQSPPETVQQMLSFADELMYSVKKSGKNGIKHVTKESAAQHSGLTDPTQSRNASAATRPEAPGAAAGPR